MNFSGIYLKYFMYLSNISRIFEVFWKYFNNFDFNVKKLSFPLLDSFLMLLATYELFISIIFLIENLTNPQKKFFVSLKGIIKIKLFIAK